MLTKRGRRLLEANRRETRGGRQEFYEGLRKPKELTHDAQVYRAYLRAAERLQERGASVRRVVLENELKRDYQRFLQERNRGRSDSTGRPDRTPEEIHRWAREHDLPDRDGHVQFPDARIEYRDVDGQTRWEDIEVETLHYRGEFAAAKASSGFTRYSGMSVRIVAAGGGSGGGASAGGSSGRSAGGSSRKGRRGPDPRLAEEFLS